MKTWLLVAALGSALAGGAACSAQDGAAAQRNDTAGATANTQATAPMGHGRGGGRGLMRADTNGDGFVTREEYTANVDQRFARMDDNGDGTLTPDERPQRGGGRMAREGNGAPSPAAGTARQGRSMTRDEFRTMSMRRFDRIDTNRDGRLDQAELAAMPGRGPRNGGTGGDMPRPHADGADEE